MSEEEFPYSFALCFSSNGQRPCSHTALTLGLEPSPVFVSFVQAVSERNIASRIAVSLSIRSMVEAAQTAADELSHTCKEILQSTFKAANSQLSEYASSMRASGHIAATGVAAIFDGEQFCVARVGQYNAHLIREGNIASFFAEKAQSPQGPFESVLGIYPKVLVDTAQVRTHDGDLIVLSSLPLSQQWTQAKDLNRQSALNSLTRSIVERGERLAGQPNSFVAAYRIGQSVIELAEVVRD